MQKEGVSGTVTLSRSQKAAAILVAFGKPTAGRLLKFFKQDELRALMEAAKELRTIPQNELERIVAEFEGEFAEGAGLLDSAATMGTILSETLTPEEMTALMGDAPPPPPDNVLKPVWPLVEALEAERVAIFLMNEHPQVAAYALTRLAPSFAAKVLLSFTKQARGEIVKRMLGVGLVAPETSLMFEAEVRAALVEDKSAEASSGGQMRVASVLNELDKSQLDEVMDDLAEAGAGNLDAIRSQLFAFEDIEHLDQRQRVMLFDDIGADVVTLALRDAEPGLTESVLSALGARARRMIEAELKADPGNLSATDVNRARKAIASTAIRLASQGTIVLRPTQEAA
ncbi:MAG: FliG C-terminal domain-containing protein [Mesorhizobium sp.]